MNRYNWRFPTVFLLLSLASTTFAQQWATNTPLPTGIGFSALSQWNGFLYQTGGLSSNGFAFATNVIYAQTFADGTVGPWQSGPALPEAVFYHAGVTVRGYIYVLGGVNYTMQTGLHSSAQIYYSQIKPDGSLSAWQTNTPLPMVLKSEAACVWGSNIYIVGGEGPISASGVYSATVHADGTLSTWTMQTPPTGLDSPAVCVANGTLYVLGSGGGSGEVYGNTVYYSKINADGTLAGWSQTTALLQPLATTGAVAANGRVFYFGGLASGNTVQNGFYSAQISGDSTLSAWSAGPTLPQPVYGFGTAVVVSNIFVTGGVSFVENTNGNLQMVYHSDVYSFPLPPAPSSPTLTGQGVDTNNTFHLQLSSTANTGFGILASPDFTNWTNVGWGFTDTNGFLLFRDTNAAAFPVRFYRAYWPLP